MKSVVFLAILCAFASAASGLTLKEAFEHVHSELGLVLSAMTMEWEYYGYFDETSCFFIQRLAPLWYDAFQIIYADQDFLELENEFTAAGVNWRTFMTDEVERAVGHVPFLRYPLHECTFNYLGGINELRYAVKNQWDDRYTYVETAVNYARANSPEYAAIYNRVSANAQAAQNLRCSEEMKRVYSLMAEYQFELNFFFDIFGVMFGFPVPDAC